MNDATNIKGSVAAKIEFTDRAKILGMVPDLHRQEDTKFKSEVKKEPHGYKT